MLVHLNSPHFHSTSHPAESSDPQGHRQANRVSSRDKGNGGVRGRAEASPWSDRSSEGERVCKLRDGNCPARHDRSRFRLMQETCFCMWGEKHWWSGFRGKERSSGWCNFRVKQAQAGGCFCQTDPTTRIWILAVSKIKKKKKEEALSFVFTHTNNSAFILRENNTF